MTTIAANTKMMVGDTRVTIGSGHAYPTKKISKAHGCIYGACGDAGDCTRFLEWAEDGLKPKSKPKFEHTTGEGTIDCLIVTSEGLFFYTPSYPSPERIEAEFFAVGSGGKAARAAMMMGADPIQAVEIACQVDTYSGLPLTVYELKSEPVSEV